MDFWHDHDDRPFLLTPVVMVCVNERVHMDAVHGGVTLDMQDCTLTRMPFKHNPGPHHKNAVEGEQEKRTATERALDMPREGQWTRQAAVIVDNRMRPVIRRNPDRHMRRLGVQVAARERVPNIILGHAHIPFLPTMVTQDPRGPHPPPMRLIEVASSLRTFEDCFTPEALDRFHNWVANVNFDVAQSTVNPGGGHRVRNPQGSAAGELRLADYDYTPACRAVICAGGFLAVARDGTVSLIQQGRPMPGSFGFNAKRLIAEAKRINWQDRELIHFLEWGF